MSLQPIQSPWKIWTIFLFTNVGKPSIYRESTPWAVSKKKWDTKEDEGKSMMMHALYLLQYACWAEVTSISEKIKPVALSVIELSLSEGIRQAGKQAVRQAVSQSLEIH